MIFRFLNLSKMSRLLTLFFVLILILILILTLTLISILILILLSILLLMLFFDITTYHRKTKYGSFITILKDIWNIREKQENNQKYKIPIDQSLKNQDLIVNDLEYKKINR